MTTETLFAWGLEVWREPLPPDVVARSAETHDAFYDHMSELLDALVRRYGRFVVLDLHSYNHRRDAPQSCEACAAFEEG